MTDPSRCTTCRTSVTAGLAESLGKLLLAVTYGNSAQCGLNCEGTGVLGLSGGAYAALVHSRPLGASCWAGFHGCVILMSYFALIQEASQATRGVADPVNSWIAGSGAGYILSATQQGHRSGVKTALWGGLAVGSLHYLKDSIPVGVIRNVLVSWDLLDPLEPSQIPQVNEEPAVDPGRVPLWWERYMPVRRISKEEAMQRKASEAALLRQMIDQMDPPQTRTSEIQQVLSHEDK